MNLGSGTHGHLLSAILLTTAVVVGCGQNTGPSGVASAPHTDDHDHAEDGHDHDEDGHDHQKDGHNHKGFWCSEHGVPEEICAQCYPKVAAEFQKKGDWCEEHKRPDSQCFIHHPENQDKFIAQYEAKFGEKPPAAKVD